MSGCKGRNNEKFEDQPRKVENGGTAERRNANKSQRIKN